MCTSFEKEAQEVWQPSCYGIKKMFFNININIVQRY